jgi:hypothetical protein
MRMFESDEWAYSKHMRYVNDIKVEELVFNGVSWRDLANEVL